MAREVVDDAVFRHRIRDRDPAGDRFDLHRTQADLGEEAPLVADLAELPHPQRPIGLQRQAGEQVAEQLRGAEADRQAGHRGEGEHQGGREAQLQQQLVDQGHSHHPRHDPAGGHHPVAGARQPPDVLTARKPHQTFRHRTPQSFKKQKHQQHEQAEEGGFKQHREHHQGQAGVVEVVVHEQLSGLGGDHHRQHQHHALPGQRIAHPDPGRISGDGAKRADQLPEQQPQQHQQQADRQHRKHQPEQGLPEQHLGLHTGPQAGRKVQVPLGREQAARGVDEIGVEIAGDKGLITEILHLPAHLGVHGRSVRHRDG